MAVVSGEKVGERSVGIRELGQAQGSHTEGTERQYPLLVAWNHHLLLSVGKLSEKPSGAGQCSWLEGLLLQALGPSPSIGDARVGTFVWHGGLMRWETLSSPSGPSRK